MSTLYGVSLGPGDPDLITRRAWKLLGGGGHWTYPVRSCKSESFALDIVKRGGLVLPPESTALLFPMTHDKGKLAKHWTEAARRVVEILSSARDVLFLVEGDASTFSTFGYLARTVRALDASAKIVTIPGVPSFNVAAAELGMPLAETDDTLAIVPAGYGIEMIDDLLADFDTLVLLKVKPVIDTLIELLMERKLLSTSQFIERAGTPQERIVRDLRELRGTTPNYLSLVLVRNPHRKRGEVIRGCRKKETVKTS